VELLGRLRTIRKAVGDGCVYEGRRYDGWMRTPASRPARGSGRRRWTRCRARSAAASCRPASCRSLPWFGTLDGYAPYEALKREREARIARIRPELERIEAESGLATAR